MSTVKKVWGLGDAVVDLLPEKPGTLLQCPVVRLPMLPWAWPDWGPERVCRVCGDDPFGRFMRKTRLMRVWTRRICIPTLCTGLPQWWCRWCRVVNEPSHLWCALRQTFSLPLMIYRPFVPVNGCIPAPMP